MSKLGCLPFIFAILYPYLLSGQCDIDVNFNNWQQGGDPDFGDWEVKNFGNEVVQKINGDPTIYYTPFDLINVEIEGTINVGNDEDDDYVGFVFGYQNPIGNAAYDFYDFWLFDWKKGNQEEDIGDCPVTTAYEGFALSKVYGTITEDCSTNGIWNCFWGHNSNSYFNVLATDYGNNGWDHNTDHHVKLIYTYTEIVIIIDGETIFQESGCFQPGRFGFYNYSQKGVTYSNFSYSLFTDFNVSDICEGELAACIVTCEPSVDLSHVDSVIWIFGDGETLVIDDVHASSINQQHLYENVGTYTIEMITVDKNGCRDTTENSIEVFENPDFSLPADTSICSYETLILDAESQSSTYQWSDGSTSSSIEVLEGGLYWVKVKKGICELIDSIQVNYILPVEVELGEDMTICDNEIITLDAYHPSATSYLWQDNLQSATYSAGGPGIYQVTVTNDCFTANDSILLIESVPMEPPPNQDTTICEGDLITLDVSTDNADSYRWEDGALSPQLDTNTAGVYSVLIKSLCEEINHDIIVSSEICCKLYFPNAFSPNFDGINDEFKPEYNPEDCDVIKLFEFRVFNRWGGLVFFTDEKSKGWDGTHKGQVASEDVYIWSCSYKIGSIHISEKGGVNLVR